MLAVRDAQWFVARLQVLTEVRDIFDRLRRDLGLPVPDRAGLTVVPA